MTQPAGRHHLGPQLVMRYLQPLCPIARAVEPRDHAWNGELCKTHTNGIVRSANGAVKRKWCGVFSFTASNTNKVVVFVNFFGPLDIFVGVDMLTQSFTPGDLFRLRVDPLMLASGPTKTARTVLPFKAPAPGPRPGTLSFPKVGPCRVLRQNQSFAVESRVHYSKPKLGEFVGGSQPLGLRLLPKGARGSEVAQASP